MTMDACLMLAVETVKQFEFCQLKAYPSPITNWQPFTIGWGHTSYVDGTYVKPGDVITQEEADAMLMQTLRYLYRTLRVRIEQWNSLSISQRAALLDFSFQYGADFYGNPLFHTLTDCLRHGLLTLVPAALELYVSPGTKDELLFRQRRHAEIVLWKMTTP